MKNTKIFAAALIAALGFTACAKDGGEKIDNGANGVGSVTITVGKATETRAEGSSTTTEPSTGVENEVNMIEFFSFDAGAPTTTGAYFRKNTNTIAGATTFLVTAGDISFLAVVNGSLFADKDAYDAYLGGKNLADIKKLVADLALTSATSQTAPVTGTGFVMAAEATAVTVTAGETNNLSMGLNRVLSKVMAPALKAGTGGSVESSLMADAQAMQTLFGVDIDGSDTVEEIEWVYDGYVVINGIKNSYNFRYTGWTGWTAPFVAPDLAANWNKTTYVAADGKDIATAYAVGAAADKFILPSNTLPVYVYENRPTRAQATPGSATVFAQDEVTAFLIKGHFVAKVNNTAGTVSPTRYWRVNLLKADAWDVYRNSVYRLFMDEVKTIGWGTPKEAEEDGPIVDPAESSISIDLVINNWDLRTETVDL